MATVKKCDRCGVIYTFEEKEHLIKNNKVYYVKLSNSVYDRIVEYDLCDECVKQLFVFAINKED